MTVDFGTPCTPLSEPSGSRTPRLSTLLAGVYNPRMQLSARNQLKGKVKTVTLGAIMAEVVIDIGGQDMVSEISKGSAERLALKTGDAVTVIVKATEVMIGK
jgi:molybdopterin-binding protein